MAGTATVKGGSGRPLEHRHRLDIIRIDARYSVAEVESSGTAGTAEVGVVQRHAVDNIERLVVAGHFCVTTQHDTGAAAGTTRGLAHYQTSHLTGQRVDDIGFLGFFQFVALHFSHTVAKGLAVALDAEGGDDDLVERLLVLFQHHRHAVGGFHGLGLEAYVTDLKKGARAHAQREMAVEVGDRGLVLGAFHPYGGSDDWLCAVGDGARHRLYLVGDG